MSESADINARLEAAAIKAEGGSEILRRFANEPVGAYITTESGDIPSIAEWLALQAGALNTFPAAFGDSTDPAKGAALGGYKGRTIFQRLADVPSPMDLPFSARGDGVVDDTAAFAAFEASINGRPVDLVGRVYRVSQVPNGNAYFNGAWKLGTFTQAAMITGPFFTGAPKFHPYGGQLSDLVQALANPFVQYLGIVFIGDSITWGSGNTDEQAPTEPRDGTLSDPRDYYGTPSYVNLLKRYIQRRYAPNSGPILSNWVASPSGESIAEFRVTHVMYPRYGDVSVVQAAGGSMSITDSLNSGLPGGGQLRLASANEGVVNSHTISFTFTGGAFRLYFACIEADATYYDVLVDGALISTHSMQAGAVATSGTVVAGSNANFNDHAFGYVKGKTVTIRTNRNGQAGLRTARFEGIEITKRIVLSNQGINGSSYRVYRSYNLSGSFGDGVAVGADDSFVFIQLGTNDRGIPAANQYARGQNILQGEVISTLDALPATVSPILMIANPASNESGSQYWYSMREVRDTIIRVGKTRAIDVIDNHSAFSDVSMAGLTSDGLHPNRVGHQVIANNIINAMEST